MKRDQMLFSDPVFYSFRKNEDMNVHTHRFHELFSGFSLGLLVKLSYGSHTFFVLVVDLYPGNVFRKIQFRT